MDIELIRTFQRVASLGSISKTADQSYVSVSTVTGRIKALEEELGKSLFHRVGRRIDLTDEGTQFLDYVERFLRILQEGEDKISQLKNTHTGELNLAVTLTVANYLLPKLLRKFRSSYPQIHLKLMVHPYYKVMNKVISGKVELGIVDHPIEAEGGVNAKHWFEDPIVPVMSINHPLSERDKLKPHDLKYFPILRSNSHSHEEEVIKKWFHGAGVFPYSILEVNDVEIIKQMLDQLEAISFLPRTSVMEELLKEKVVTLPLSPTLPLKRETAFIYRHNLQLSLAAKTFIEFASDQTDDLLY